MKRYIRSSVDRSEDGVYQQLFADVYEKVLDNLTESASAIPAQEMMNEVNGYDADWCADEFLNDDHDKAITSALRKLATLITEDYFRNYGN